MSESEGLLLLSQLKHSVGNLHDLYGFNVNAIRFFYVGSSKGQRAYVQDDENDADLSAFGVPALEVDRHLASLVSRTKRSLKAALRCKPDDALCRLSVAEVFLIQAARCACAMS